MLFSISEITSNSDLLAEPSRATSGIFCCALGIAHMLDDELLGDLRDARSAHTRVRSG